MAVHASSAVAGANYYFVIGRHTVGAPTLSTTTPYTAWVAGSSVTTSMRLPQGGYRFVVAAYSNATGFGAFSPETASDLFTHSVPGQLAAAPTAAGSATTATVSWTAPTVTGFPGVPIDYYRIMLTPTIGGPATVVWALGASTSTTIYTAGIGTYTARVQSFSNVYGFGVTSPPSAPFTIS